MGQQPQLDLGVVRVHQHTALRRGEHPPQLAAQLRAGGNILQIRLGGAEPPRGRHRHLEAGAHPAVRVDDLQKAVHIGAFQLGVLPVAQHVRHDRRIVPQLLQHIGVGGPSGFRLFPVGQPQLFKQDGPQLLGRVDVERLPRCGVDGLLRLVHDALQRLAVLGQRLPVHQKARRLHLRQHPAQRQLHIVVQRLHIQLPQLGRQCPAERRHGGGIADESRLRRRVVPQQGGKRLLRQMGRLGQLLVVEGEEQLGDIVAAGGGVTKVGRQRRVEHKTLGGQLPLQQGAHGVLDVMSHLFDVRREQRRQQIMPVPGVAAFVQLRHQGRVLPRFTLYRQCREIRQTIDGDMICRPPQGQQLLCPRRRLHDLHIGCAGRLFFRGAFGGQTVLVNELLELQTQEQVIQLRLEGPAQVVLRLEVQRCVGDDGGQPVAVPCRRLPLLQLAEGGGLGVYVRHLRVQRVDAAVLLHQRHGGLLSDARYAGDVVRAVAHQRLQVDHVNGIKAVGLPERLRRHILCGGLAHAGGHQLHLGVVGDKLETVLVAGDHDAVPAIGLAFAADGADEVVGLIAGQLVLGDAHSRQHLLQRQQLHGQLLRHPLALGLVGRIRLMAERRLPPVEGDAQRLRLLLIQQTLERGNEAVDGVGVQALPCGQGPDAVIGAVDDAVAVENHQFHREPPKIP